MSMPPADIQAQTFRVVFRGYDVGEVDDFLTKIQAELTRLHEGSAPTAGAGVPSAGPERTAGRDAVPNGPAEDSSAAPRAVRTLLRAEQMADQMVADASAEAAQIRARAHAEADELLAEAHAAGGREEAEQRARCRRELDALAGQRDQLQAEVDRLGDLERRCRDGLQRWLAEHARLLERELPTRLAVVS